MSDETSRPDTRFLVDVHVHAVASAGQQALAEEVNSPESPTWPVDTADDYSQSTAPNFLWVPSAPVI